MGEWYKLTYGDGETDVIRIKEGHDRHEREGDTWEPAVVFTVKELDAREKNWSDSVAVLTKMCLEYIEHIAELEQENKGLYALLADRARAYSELKAQLAERSEWEVLTGDSTDYSTLEPSVGIWAYHEDGHEISISTKDIEIFAPLPDNIRLCRRVQREVDSNE